MTTSTVHAGLALNVLQAARALGLDTDALMRPAGLRWDEVRDPDGRLAEDKFLGVLEAIERQDQVPDFGLQLGREFRIETLGAVGYAISAAENLELALRTLIRFSRLVHQETMYECRVSDAELYFGRALDARYARIRHSTVMSLAGTLTLARTLTGRTTLAPLRIQLQHARPADAARYDEFFGVAVEFDAIVTAITLPGWAAPLPLVRHDPGLFTYLSRHAEALVASLPTRGETVADRVRTLVMEVLRTGTVTKAGVARRLALSERTLQRRLSEEGTSFAQLVDDVRRALAHEYLADRRLAVYEVAGLLGYSEPSAFFRAFRRWTGKTPLEVRQSPSR